MIFSWFITFTAFVIALVGTRMLILAFRNHPLMLDRPNARSNHATPVPKGGGLAVVFALIIPLLLADIDVPIVLAVLMLAAVSLLDDLIGVPPLVRLLVQAMAVSIALAFVPVELTGGLLSPLAEKVVVAVVWIWFINLFNFMDGIDGISACEMVSIGFGLALLMIFADYFPSPLADYGMIMAAAGLGFWWWNRHPARIFLGDVGSIPIGFLLGYLLLLAAASGFLGPALILPAYYLADATITAAKRLVRGEKLWVAHSSHYYQRAARAGMQHQIIVRYVVGVNILLGFLAIACVLNPPWQPLFVVLAYMVVLILLSFFSHLRENGVSKAP